MHPYLQGQSPFLASGKDYDSAKWVLFGLPFDLGVSFRPGARHAPGRIREVSLLGMETFCPICDASLEERSFFDAGEVEMPSGDLIGSLARIREVAQSIYKAGKQPLAIGGDHLVSLPLIEAAAEAHPELHVLHFDAHTDLRESFSGSRLSHATVLRHAFGFLKPRHLWQFGIRNSTAEEICWANGRVRQYWDDELRPLQKIKSELVGYPIYITLDIDVLDPAYAPGTGTPEAGGISSRELLQALHALSGLNIVGMDLVEVAPPLDDHDRTSILAAKIVREALLIFGG